MIFIFILFSILIIMGIIEKQIHTKNLNSIPIRIHVNGTRGKSSTTRLIAAGLREAGYKVLAKTTGTAARIIFEDGHEIPIKRRGNPRIIEQEKIVSLASKRGVDILVVECMAINPEMQWVSEHQLIKSQMAVLTNIRQDHSDEMGTNLTEIAETLTIAIPTNAQLVTAEDKFLKKIKSKAAERNTVVHFVRGKDILDQEIAGFNRPIFYDNLACALKICSLLDVNRKVALQGMLKSTPDPGEMKIWSINIGKKNIYFINAFAANDYQSTIQVWERWRTDKRYAFMINLPIFGLLNNRSDRGFRLKELSSLFSDEIEVDKIILIGSMKFIAKRLLEKADVERNDIITYGLKKSDISVKMLIDELANMAENDLVLFAFGNIQKYGQTIVEYFARNGDEVI